MEAVIDVDFQIVGLGHVDESKHSITVNQQEIAAMEGQMLTSLHFL